MKSPKSLADRRAAESKASLAQLERYLWRTWKEPLGSVLGSRIAWLDRAWQSPCCIDGKIKSAEKLAVYPNFTQHGVPGSEPTAFLSGEGKSLFFSDHRIQSCRVCPYSFYLHGSSFREEIIPGLSHRSSGGFGGNILSKRLEGLLT